MGYGHSLCSLNFEFCADVSFAGEDEEESELTMVVSLVPSQCNRILSAMANRGDLGRYDHIITVPHRTLDIDESGSHPLQKAIFSLRNMFF